MELRILRKWKINQCSFLIGNFVGNKILWQGHWYWLLYLSITEAKFLENYRNFPKNGDNILHMLDVFVQIVFSCSRRDLEFCGFFGLWSLDGALSILHQGGSKVSELYKYKNWFLWHKNPVCRDSLFQTSEKKRKKSTSVQNRQKIKKHLPIYGKSCQTVCVISCID